ncbi:MAG TPA: succinate dehydrogenase, cytochrome b556 subunit [Steroidobacteraceae bacterium]|nr:succinate dehydrogenase, cytochrome b556 subunit [Steroidobacteraceae bacterium]
MSARQPSGAPARGRPLSPHLSIYKMSRYSLLSSISNRATGIVLTCGQLLLVYWLIAAASGAQAYARAAAVLASPALKAVYAVLLAAFAYHLAAGIRHLVWDTGHGLARDQSRRSAGWVITIAVLLAAALIVWMVLGGASAP